MRFSTSLRRLPVRVRVRMMARSPPQAYWCVGNNRQESLNVIGGQSSGRRRRGLGPLQLVAGVGSDQTHADKEIISFSHLC